jgi:hypothetical protein
MVQYNKKTLLSLTQSTDNNMKSFRSQPLPQSPRPLSCATEFWAKQQRATNHALRHGIYGRIQDTGVNFIVEGMRCGRWTTIPCRTLLDARLYLGEIMDKASFDMNKAQFGRKPLRK